MVEGLSNCLVVLVVHYNGTPTFPCRDLSEGVIPREGVYRKFGSFLVFFLDSLGGLSFDFFLLTRAAHMDQGEL